jgi:hypothetical protein
MCLSEARLRGGRIANHPRQVNVSRRLQAMAAAFAVPRAGTRASGSLARRVPATHGDVTILKSKVCHTSWP